MKIEPSQKLNNYLDSEIGPFYSRKDSFLQYSLCFFYTISLASVIYVLYVIKTIPLLDILNGTGNALLDEFRIDVSRGFKGNVYIKNIFALGLTPILSYIAFSYYKLYKTFFNLAWFLIMFIASILVVTYSTAKAPLIMYLLGYMFLIILIDGKLKVRYIVTFLLLSFTLIIFMYIRLTGMVDPSILFSYNTGILGRIFLSLAAGTYFTFDLFPSKIDFIGIKSISNVLNWVLGMENIERSARLIMETINPKAVELGTGGVYNTLFVAEAWANFGKIGLLFSPFYVGAIIQIQYLIFLRLPKTPLLMGLYSFLCLRTSGVTGGFNEFIYNGAVLTLIVVMIIIIIGAKVLKANKEILNA